MLAKSKVTCRALVTILQEARSNPGILDAPCDKHSVTAAIAARYQAIEHVEKVEMLRGPKYEWPMAHPGLLLQLVLDDKPELQEMFARYDANKNHGNNDANGKGVDNKNKRAVRKVSAEVP